MILTHLPDLPPRPETPRNAAFRREFYRRWGKENWIVCGAAQRAEYAVFRQTLSIKTVTRGREHYFVDGRRLSVTDETWLVLNEGREYASLLEGAENPFSFCLFFRPGMAAEIGAATQMRLAKALDHGPCIRLGGHEFAEGLRPHDRSITPVLQFIRRQVEVGVTDEGWWEEQFDFLLARMLRNERRTAQLPERLDCVRATTRRELIRRIQWATDFMHSNLHRSLTLSEISVAARLSSYHFLRVFRQVHGVTPMTYLRQARTQRALALLRTTDMDISDVTRLVGLSRSSLWRYVRSARGDAPSALRALEKSS